MVLDIKELDVELQKMIDGDKLAISRPLVIGRPSRILIQCGADPDQSVTITKKVIDKSMRSEARDQNGRLIGNTGHGLTKEMLISAIKEFESPLLIFRGRQDNSLLIITDVKDQKNRSIVIAIELERQEGFTKMISIRSIYGRDNLSFYISSNIDDGNLLAAKKNKADELLRSIGKSYPKENTFISFE